MRLEGWWRSAAALGSGSSGSCPVMRLERVKEIGFINYIDRTREINKNYSKDRPIKDGMPSRKICYN